MNIILSKSNLKDKRFKVVIDNKKTIHFGLKNPKIGTFIDHGNKVIRENYIKRHQPRENWSKSGGINTAGFWAYHLLWGKYPNLAKNISYVENKFDIKIKSDI